MITEKIIKEEIREVVTTGFKDKTVYVCSDGKEFDGKLRAEDHEEYLFRLEEIKKMEEEMSRTEIEERVIYFLKNKTKMRDYLKLKHGRVDTHFDYCEEETWVYEEYYGGGDYSDSYTYYPVQNLFDEVEKIREVIIKCSLQR